MGGGGSQLAGSSVLPGAFLKRRAEMWDEQRARPSCLTKDCVSAAEARSSP
jgi:hypothetical protein